MARASLKKAKLGPKDCGFGEPHGKQKKTISNNLGKRSNCRESSAFAHNGGTFEMDDELDDLEDNYNNFDESFNDFGDRSRTSFPNNITRKWNSNFQTGACREGMM